MRDDSGFFPGLVVGGLLIFVMTVVIDSCTGQMPEKEFQRQAVKNGAGEFSARPDGSVEFKWLTKPAKEIENE